MFDALITMLVYARLMKRIGVKSEFISYELNLEDLDPS